MDPLTHALSGAVLARATAPSRTQPGALPLRIRMGVAFAAAAFPDLDFALRLIDTITYLNWHQGLTHSLPMVPVWAFLLAHLFARLWRGRYRWQAFFVPACLGLAIHIAGDLITAYGLMLFAPFSTWRFSLPFAFVIDPWITVFLAAGLLGGGLLPRSRVPSIAALILVAGYVGALSVQHDRALDAARAHAALHESTTPARIDVLPQPFSPLHWKLVVGIDDAYDIARVRLDTRPYPFADALPKPLAGVAAAYRPLDTAVWTPMSRFGTDDTAFAREAWQQPAFADFRRFAAFPVLDGTERDASRSCAWFVDLRFVLPSMAPSFRFGSCQDANGRWSLQRQRGAFWID